MNKPDQTAPKLKRPFKLKALSVLDRLPSALLVALLPFGQPATVVRLFAQEAPPSTDGQLSDPSPSGAPAIWTDQADYAAGSTAVIAGSGFLPAESIVVQVLHADGTSDSGEDHQPWTAMADADGHFKTEWRVCVGLLFRVTAIGQQSSLTAQATFTDSPTYPLTPSPLRYF